MDTWSPSRTVRLPKRRNHPFSPTELKRNDNQRCLRFKAAIPASVGAVSSSGCLGTPKGFANWWVAWSYAVLAELNLQRVAARLDAPPHLLVPAYQLNIDPCVALVDDPVVFRAVADVLVCRTSTMFDPVAPFHGRIQARPAQAPRPGSEIDHQ